CRRRTTSNCSESPDKLCACNAESGAETRTSSRTLATRSIAATIDRLQHRSQNRRRENLDALIHSALPTLPESLRRRVSRTPPFALVPRFCSRRRRLRSWTLASGDLASRTGGNPPAIFPLRALIAQARRVFISCSRRCTD